MIGVLLGAVVAAIIVFAYTKTTLYIFNSMVKEGRRVTGITDFALCLSVILSVGILAVGLGIADRGYILHIVNWGVSATLIIFIIKNRHVVLGGRKNK